MQKSYFLKESKLKLIKFVLSFFVITGVFISVIHFIKEGPTMRFYSQIIGTLTAFLIGWYFKRVQSVSRTTNILAVFGFCFLTYRYYQYADYRAPTVIWFMIIAPTVAWLGEPFYAIVCVALNFIVLIINIFLIFNQTNMLPTSVESIYIFGAFAISGYLTYLVLETKVLYERISQSIIKIEKEKIHNNQLITLGEFAGNIAHEINNPLQVIKGNASRLKRKAKAKDNLTFDQIQQYAENIDQTVDRTNKLIHSLLKLARFPDTEFPTKEFPFNVIWDDVSPLLQEKIKSYGINLSITNGEQIIYGNADLIGQVLLNLINNSIYEIKYKEDPWININITTNYIDIIDSGYGISPELKDKILNPFFSTKKQEGTGLGLNLSQNLMLQIGGKLQLLDHTTHTTFRLVLPTKSS